MNKELKDLRTDILGCNKCNFSITNKVIGKGSFNPDILFIAEAPGYEEDKKGIPMIGRSGRLLDEWIKNLNINNYAVTNILKCRPKNNRNPTNEEILNCKPYLKRQIEILKPKTIIVLGKIAFKTLCPKNYTGTIINHIEKKYFYNNIPVIILPHPSYCLRNLDFFLDFNQIETQINNNIFINDYNNLNKLKNIFSFDTETYGLKYDELDLKDISFHDGLNSFYFDKNNINKEKLKEIFLNSKKIIGHNLIFDFTVLTKFFNRDFLFQISSKELFDTMIAQYIINENEKKGLKYLSEKILKEKMVNYDEANNLMDKQKWIDYSIADSVQTFKLYEYFLPKIKSNPVFDREMKAIIPIVDMQYNGFLIDKEKISIVKKDIINKLDITKNNMNTIFKKHKYSISKTLFSGELLPININSPKQLLKFINEKLEINIDSTARKILEGIKNKHDFINFLLEYRHLFKLNNSYLDPLLNEHIQSDEKVHPSFNPCGTVTGRYSSQNINFQQIPRDDKTGLRNIFISKTGYSIVSFDYSSQELRLISIISKDKNMLEAFHKKKDLHLLTANTIFNLKIPDKCIMKTNFQYKEYKNKFKKERNIAKGVNFGIAYGAGVKKIAKVSNVDEIKAREILDNFFSYYKGIKKAMYESKKEVNLNKYSINMFGRKRRFTEIDYKAERQSFNFKIQGAAADIMKIVLYRVWNNVILKYGKIIKLKATIHDEIVFEIKDEYIDEIIPLIKHEMENFDFPVKMEVEYGIGKSYGEAK